MNIGVVLLFLVLQGSEGEIKTHPLKFQERDFVLLTVTQFIGYIEKGKTEPAKGLCAEEFLKGKNIITDKISFDDVSTEKNLRIREIELKRLEDENAEVLLTKRSNEQIVVFLKKKEERWWIYGIGKYEKGKNDEKEPNSEY